ncbi:Syntaxin-52 [Bienertia sinuspersici]
MASKSGDSWMKESNEATKLADDISGMITEKTGMSGSGSESQRHFSAVRRKITFLGTRLDSLESLLSKLLSKQSIHEISLEILEITKELNRRKDITFKFANKDEPNGNHFEHAKFC